jgi:DNA-3-methyladenine glycosylase I
MTRCGWADSSTAMASYHDHEWGRPSRDDRHLFEMLVLEGAQAGLSWSTILTKRESYRRAFDGFAVAAVADYDEARLAQLQTDAGIVRNRLKLRSAVLNARAVSVLAAEHGSFATWLWSWVDGTPIVNQPSTMAEVPPRSELSERLSRELGRRGFSFVGPTIVYAYLQSVGLVDDHLVGCPAKSAAGARV